ncbi:methylated-DNA--[protein]-cysteine S-methyltransferase [Flavihumibacter rivuli]|uniref:methylated-DNA--[protein]-cysteine S-methyltransferase n=1 Tax=Flavihumibacter rivuli TaxID=2838156 RepID=UPI001BDDCD44|nr:methylated-DNA--[protein]-cysteine S-methyltransferase [Flavihumibacter rivuli]ULQ55233.1 methylated-DNA--[protein]-cysteine S-methyltransferase [Flavihumibacter rivuli]
MNQQQQLNFDRIAKAIEYLRDNFREQPDLDLVAEKVHLSPFHFQRMFTDWAGVSPKKFLQYLNLEYAKTILTKEGATLFDAAAEAGLSGTSRLHDLFVKIEGMTPGEFKNGGEKLSINYSFAETPFGKVLVASTEKGICHMAFVEDEAAGFELLQQQFPKAGYHQVVDMIQQNALYIFNQDWSRLQEIKLHLKGSPFQLKVWETLLKIPMGKLATYGQVAREISQPNASRAVGTAIGSNPVAFLIPCHRVIQATGAIGGYMWGPTRKAAIIAWEGARGSAYAEASMD